MELLARVASLSTLTWMFSPSGHSGISLPAGKKHALPLKMPTSSSGMSAVKTPGAVSWSGMSDQARASGVSPRSVSAMISWRWILAWPMFVRKTARPSRGGLTSSFTASVSPRHFNR